MFNDIIDSYLNFIDWFYSYDWGTFIFRLKIISVLISLALLWGIILVNKKIRALGVKKETIPEIPRIPPEEVSKSWQTVLDRMSSANPSDWNLAVIKADSILDDILKRSGFAGETMGDRLKQLDASKLSSLNDVWMAHKIRNAIAHDANRPMSRRELESAIDAYEKALKELEFLV